MTMKVGGVKADDDDDWKRQRDEKKSEAEDDWCRRVQRDHITMKMLRVEQQETAARQVYQVLQSRKTIES
jgi:hypothetical protein